MTGRFTPWANGRVKPRARLERVVPRKALAAGAGPGQTIAPNFPRHLFTPSNTLGKIGNEFWKGGVDGL